MTPMSRTERPCASMARFWPARSQKVFGEISGHPILATGQRRRGSRRSRGGVTAQTRDPFAGWNRTMSGSKSGSRRPRHDDLALARRRTRAGRDIGRSAVKKRQAQGAVGFAGYGDEYFPARAVGGEALESPPAWTIRIRRSGEDLDRRLRPTPRRPGPCSRLQDLGRHRIVLPPLPTRFPRGPKPRGFPDTGDEPQAIPEFELGSIGRRLVLIGCGDDRDNPRRRFHYFRFGLDLGFDPGVRPGNAVLKGIRDVQPIEGCGRC